MYCVPFEEIDGSTSSKDGQSLYVAIEKLFLVKTFYCFQLFCYYRMKNYTKV